jgi:hypothetical protein
MYSFFSQVKARASPVFTVKVESVTHVGDKVVFLDLIVGVDVPRLSLEANQDKPITPLCPSSCHNPSVHASWPNTVCNRVCSLSDSKLESLAALARRYVCANAHPYTIALFESWQPKSGSHMGSITAASSSAGAAVAAATAAEQPRKIAFVTRYHPMFRKLFHRALLATPPPRELQVAIFPAWKNALTSLSAVVCQSNANTCKIFCREGRREGSLCVSNLSTGPLHNFSLRSLSMLQ